MTPVKIVVLPYRKPRKSERTWPMIKGSVANVGRQAVVLAQQVINKRSHG